MKKQDFVNCIKCYFDKKHDLTMNGSSTPKISVYYMIGYLSITLGPKVAKELELYMDKIMIERQK